MNSNAAKWIEALRSGEYEQGRGRLHAIRDGADVYCCLGVACDVFMKEGNELHTRHYGHGVAYNGQPCSLPFQVRSWLGLLDTSGSSAGAKQASLITVNDYQKLNFEQIADLIESEPEGMFLKDAA